MSFSLFNYVQSNSGGKSSGTLPIGYGTDTLVGYTGSSKGIQDSLNADRWTLLSGNNIPDPSKDTPNPSNPNNSPILQHPNWQNTNTGQNLLNPFQISISSPTNNDYLAAFQSGTPINLNPTVVKTTTLGYVDPTGADISTVKPPPTNNNLIPPYGMDAIFSLLYGGLASYLRGNKTPMIILSKQVPKFIVDSILLGLESLSSDLIVNYTSSPLFNLLSGVITISPSIQNMTNRYLYSPTLEGIQQLLVKKGMNQLQSSIAAEFFMASLVKAAANVSADQIINYTGFSF